MKKRNILVTILAALGAASIVHYINEMIMQHAVSRFKDADAGGSTYHWKHGDIYYRKEGAGQAMLLLHDISPGSSSAQWKSSASRFAQFHTVYAVDMPGCGRSARPAVDYTVYFYVSMIRSFLKDIVKEPVTIVAAPSCENIAYAVAALEPGRVRELNIIKGEDTVSKIGPVQARILAWLLTKPTVGKSVYNFMYTHAAIGSRLLVNRLAGASVDPGDIEQAYAVSHLAGGNGRYLLASKLNGNMAADTEHLMKQLRAPVHYYKDAKEI